MKITKKWLERNGACWEGTEWFLSQKSTDIEAVIKKLTLQGKFIWANWTITRAMTHKQNVKYACFSALQCLEHFEAGFPTDKRPRQAVEAALKWVNNPTEENKVAAESAAWAAWAAAGAAAWKILLKFGIKLILNKAVEAPSL